MSITLRELTRFYEREEMRFNVNEERQAISLKMSIKSLGQSIDFRAVIANPTHVLFYSYFPVPISAEKRAAAAEFIARANYNLHDGNFEMDMNDGEVRYKACLYVGEHDRMSDEMLGRMTYVGFGMVDQYGPALMAMLYGGKSAQQAIADAERSEEEQTAAPAAPAGLPKPPEIPPV